MADRKTLQSHRRDLLDDVHRMVRSPFSFLVRRPYEQTLAVDLMRIYQDEELTLEQTLDMVDIIEGPYRQVQIVLKIPAKNRQSKLIQLDLIEQLGFGMKETDGVLTLTSRVHDASEYVM